MLYGAEINGVNTLDEYGLMLCADLKIGEPKLKQNLVDIPGGDGALNMSYSPQGRAVYEMRAISFSLFKPCVETERETLVNTLRNLWHGQVVKLALPNDTTHYWQGILAIGDISGYNKGVIPVSMIAEPYKYAADGTVVEWSPDDVESGDIVTFEAGGEYPLSNVSLPLAPIQEGTGDPSPENVRPISGRTGANIHVADSVAKYGVQFNGSASAGTRLYDAVGKVANVGTDTQTATNDFDNILPWSAMRRCNTAIVNGERVPTYYEGEVGFDNVNSDVFVYCPLFFYYRSDDDNTHVVSMSPLNGYRAPSKFVKADGTLRPYVFLPAYTAGVDANGVPVSRPGYWPRCISLTAFMTLCKTKHTAGTLEADIWIEGTMDEEIIRILLDIEFATRDHQTVMQGATLMRYASDVVTTGGENECVVPAACASALVVGQAIAIGTSDKGNQVATNVTVTAIDTDTNKITLQSADGSDITVTAGNYISSRPWKSGACDTVLTPSGSPISNSNAKMPCKYRGIENPWGNQYRWRWDYLQNNHQPYVLDDPDNYDGTVNAHYTALSYTVATSNGYAVAMGFDENFPHCRVTTNVTGGSSTTYFADYYYQNTGVRALLVGGSVYNGRIAGARSCLVNGTPGDANWSLGAALSPA